MTNNSDAGETGNEIVPGISLSSTGQATVAPFLADVLFDLALKLEGPTNQPVDIEHVLAAIVLAARLGELKRDVRLSGDDEALVSKLIPHVNAVFNIHHGKVGKYD